MNEQSLCRSCQAPVLFVKSETTGRLMILDADPSSEGRIVIEGGAARVLKKDLLEQPATGPRYVDHHVTCPAAAEWRKPRKAKK